MAPGVSIIKVKGQKTRDIFPKADAWLARLLLLTQKANYF
jgi:hypothetical protein